MGRRDLRGHRPDRDRRGARRALPRRKPGHQHRAKHHSVRAGHGPTYLHERLPFGQPDRHQRGAQELGLPERERIGDGLGVAGADRHALRFTDSEPDCDRVCDPGRIAFAQSLRRTGQLTSRDLFV